MSPTDAAAPASASDNPPSRKGSEPAGVVEGSGNVFADLGLPNPEAELRAADARIAGLAEPVEAALAKLVNVAALAADRHGPGVAEALQAVRDVLRPCLLPAEMTPAIDEVLGMPNFIAGPYAHLFRAAGAEIRRKAEAEQAFVMWWLLRLVLQHGDAWRDMADADLAAARATVQAKRAAEPKP